MGTPGAKIAPGEEEDEREEEEPAAQALVGLGDGRGKRREPPLPPDVRERLGVEVSDRRPAQGEDDELECGG